MAKAAGMGARYFVDQYNLSGDTNSFGGINKGMATIEQPDITMSAMARAPGILDAGIQWVSFFNPSTGQAHPALRTPPRVDRIVSYFHRAELGTPVATMVAKQTKYDPKRDNKGGLMVDVEALANAYWLDWGKALTAGERTDTTATNGTGVDFDAAHAFGLQASVHVTAFTGTNVTIKLQESSDNGSTDAWADVVGGGFTTLTAVGKERIATSRTLAVERYLRAVTSGTFTSVTFALSATVNRTSYTP